MKKMNLWKDNRGIGVVEIVLILVILIALVVIFHDAIGQIVTDAIGQVESNSGTIMEAPKTT